MKLSTGIIISKGVAYIIVGVFTPWIAALAQWATSGEMPPKIIWLGVILPLSMVGGANAWISFTSSSWHDYQQERKSSGDTSFVTKPTTPKL